MVKGAHLWRAASALFATATVVNFTSAAARDLGGPIKNIYNNNGLGSYSFEFENTDGTYRGEDGGLVSSPHDVEEGMAVRGEYRYIDPTGHLHIVNYVADVNGFQPLPSLDDTRHNDKRIL